MKRADLHLHSNRSDGTDPPARVVQRAAEAGLAAIALTDHDSTEGLEEALQEGRRLGVEVIAGIELSSEHEGCEVHLLGYFLDPVEPHLARTLARMRDERGHRVERMVGRLNAQGIGLKLEAVRACAAGRSIGRPHVADALVQGGFVDSYDTAWRDYLRPGGLAYVGRVKVALAEGLELIARAGGVASIAHPTLNLDVAQLETLLHTQNRVTRSGLFSANSGTRPADPGESAGTVPASARIEALEVTHPKVGRMEALALRDLCKRFGLAESGGSDCHGSRRGEPTMGLSFVNLEAVEVLRRRAGADPG